MMSRRTREEAVKYIQELEKKLIERHFTYFWIDTTRADFKPIKEVSHMDMLNRFKESPKKYSGKVMAEVFVFPNPRAFAGTWENEPVFSLKVECVKVHKDGSVDTKKGDQWGLTLNWDPEDIEAGFKVTNAFIEKVMRLVASKAIYGDTLNGYRYRTTFMERLKKKGIEWVWPEPKDA